MEIVARHQDKIWTLSTFSQSGRPEGKQDAHHHPIETRQEEALHPRSYSEEAET